MPEEANPADAGAAAPQGQSPPGTSPATMPVANRGQEAAGLAALSVLANFILKLVPQLGASTDPGKDALKAAQLLLKHVPPGTVAPGVQNNAMMNMQREQQQQQPMAAMMAARGGPPPGAPPGQAPPGQAAA